MRPMMAKRKPDALDALDALMSGSMMDYDEDEDLAAHADGPPEHIRKHGGMATHGRHHAEDAGGDSDVAVMSFDDDDEPAAEPEEGTPEATIESIRKGLDELEMMLAGR